MAEEDTVLDDSAVVDATDEQDRRNALEIIEDTLSDYGLEGLTDRVNAMLMEGSSVESVLIQIKDEDIFKDRFKGMFARRRNGHPAISPAEYINLERDYRNLMETAGLPKTLRQHRRLRRVHRQRPFRSRNVTTCKYGRHSSSQR